MNQSPWADAWFMTASAISIVDCANVLTSDQVPWAGSTASWAVMLKPPSLEEGWKGRTWTPVMVGERWVSSTLASVARLASPGLTNWSGYAMSQADRSSHGSLAGRGGRSASIASMRVATSAPSPG